MTPLSKLCDAADWFHPEIARVIGEELHEIPRFHRKQWEFAMIFNALLRCRLLKGDRVGLSMGGGRERLLYAIGRCIRELVVTDLYGTGTTWDCARTDDPETFIKGDKPFPVDDRKLTVLPMDMRELQFPDHTFDFCYSSCAIEHIGTRDDVIRHLNEVARVLKDDGVYVLTTEIHYGKETIEDPNNFIFSPDFLNEIVAESGLGSEEKCIAGITPHKANYPKPPNVKNLSFSGSESFASQLLQELPHIQLLKGKHPYTSGLFLFRKRPSGRKRPAIRFIGLDPSREFMEAGVAEYRRLLDRSEVRIDPFSFMPGGISRYCTDRLIPPGDENRGPDDVETIFHTDYYWWGSERRRFEVVLHTAEGNGNHDLDLDIRVHGYKTLASSEVECAASLHVPIRGESRIGAKLEITPDDSRCYAVLGKWRRGSCLFDRIKVTSAPAR